MKRKDIAACATPTELRWLWDKHNPNGDIKKREYFINRVIQGRKAKQ